MLKIWSMKQQQQKNEAASGQTKKKKVTAAQLRVQKGESHTYILDRRLRRRQQRKLTRRTTDLSELSLPSTMKTTFPDPDDILNFTLTITPDEGLYKGGQFNFSFAISQNFPHEPPKVKCKEKIYHPNIDLEGNVCLNILREDWKPVLNLNAVVVGLQFLFLEPNASDPLNKEAANDLMADRDRFRRNVRSSMGGGQVKGEAFDRVLLK
jgi:ubiquitin-conjugating enzyme E2 M